MNRNIQPTPDMNANEQKSPEETLNLSDNAAACSAECAETSSPSLSIAEVADEQTAAAEACAETDSPALSLAEAADEAEASEETEDQKEGTRRFHEMSKDELLSNLRDIVNEKRTDSHKEVAAIKQAYFSLRNKETYDQLNAYVEAGNAPETFSADADATESELKDLLAKFKEMRSAYLEAEDARRKANLEAKQAIVEKMRTLAEDIDNINLHFNEFQTLQQEFKGVGEVPPGNDNEIWKEYQTVEELFFDRLKMNKELRDLDFKKNLELKRQIIEQAQKLLEDNDPVGSFRKLQGLHESWREIGPVAKELRDPIWEEFKAVTTAINKRHQEYFEGRKAEEQANEAKKTELCEEIEAIKVDELKGFNAWETATRKIKEIQERWRQIGFATRKNNNALFTRFRQSCDAFFAAKAEYFKQAKEDYARNLEKKIALCERAEALREAGDARKGVDEVVSLQAEWKTIGPVSRKQSDAIWHRFTTACNALFDERKKQNSAKRKEENDNLAAKRSVIERLRALPKDADRRETLNAVRELQNEWQSIGFVPFKYKDKVFAEYRELCDEIYNSLDSRENRRRMSNFEGRVDDMRGDGQRVMRERDRLVRAYEVKKSELQTYENNMGFFMVKSNAGSSMVRELERKIKKIKDEMAEIQEKIKLVDKADAKSDKKEEEA